MSSDLSRAQQYLQSGDLARCARLLDAAIRARPKDADALLLRAQAAAATRDGGDVVAWLRRAAKAAPNRWDVQYDAGCLYLQLDLVEEAARRFETAAGLNPSAIEPLVALGRIQLDRLKQPSAAAKTFQEALAIGPDDVEVPYHLGKACFQIGDAALAVTLFAQASQIAQRMQRDDVVALCRNSIAVAIPGSPSASNADILEARRQWAQSLPTARAIAVDFKARDRNPNRPLTIGYVSSFFDRENWMKPVWALLNEHDRQLFQVRIFSFGPVPGGEKPGEGVDTAWRPHDSDRILDVAGLSNEDLAKVIAEEGIDLLVDLNGYSDMKRLPLFALHPAPLVIGWFNMYATTGMSCFDYLIGDRHVVAPDEEPHYSERIARVPGSYLTFKVGYPVPPVSDPPCMATGHVTFGSLCSRYKITPEVLRAWSEILLGCPGARLLLRNAGLDNQGEREYVWAGFTRHGVAPERIELLGKAPHFQFLETYGRIDIALDTFPYNGGTTTTEAIWQGVPVVAFAGRTWASRTSATILREGGLGDWVADDVRGYVALAVDRAIDPQAMKSLSAFRSAIRQKLQCSAVCDTAAFARAMESLYREMWRDWCGRASV